MAIKRVAVPAKDDPADKLSVFAGKHDIFKKGGKIVGEAESALPAGGQFKSGNVLP